MKIKLLLVLLLILFLTSCMTEKQCKKYIINHKEDIEYIKNKEISSGNLCFFKIPYCIEDTYYTDITINYYKDDACVYIIFWGDRESWSWDWRLDKSFDIDCRDKGKEDIIIRKILDIKKDK